MYLDDYLRLNLISRLEVQEVQAGAGGDDGDVLVPRSGTSTPMRLERVVPESIGRKLRFLVSAGFDDWGHSRYRTDKTELNYGPDGEIVNQGVRTIRRLDEPSARLLDEVLGD